MYFAPKYHKKNTTTSDLFSSSIFTFLFCCSLMDNIFSVTIQREEGKFIIQGIPEVQEKNLQFIDNSSEMSDLCENVTKKVRRSNSTMSEGSDRRSPSPNATMSCSQMSSEHG